LDKHLHIVCLDVPYPPDYGGVFDLFYKIVALYQQGVKLHLHCFEYGRGSQYALNRYCVEVTYYKRRNNINALFHRVPYIVGSRANKKLLENLLKDDYPVLLEGIHCTWFLYTNELSSKKVVIRLHNVEFQYYRKLSKAASPGIRKIYFFIESMLLKSYERKIAGKALCVAVTTKDVQIYQNELGVHNIKYLPVFLPFSLVNSITGHGEFCLYHGNLSVVENEKAVFWLLNKVFTDPAIPFIIAGKNPTAKLVKFVSGKPGVTIVANPSEEVMENLIRMAHINVLPSLNETGIKIKLLNALYNGRHCIVNKEAVEGTQLEELCNIASGAVDFKKVLLKLVSQPFTQEDIDLRTRVLNELFDNDKNAEQLMRWIY